MALPNQIKLFREHTVNESLPRVASLNLSRGISLGGSPNLTGKIPANANITSTDPKVPTVYQGGRVISPRRRRNR